MAKLETEFGIEITPAVRMDGDGSENTSTAQNPIQIAKPGLSERRELLQTLVLFKAKNQQTVNRTTESSTPKSITAKTKKSTAKRKTASPQTSPDSVELLKLDPFDYSGSISGTDYTIATSKRGGKLPYNTACQSCKDSHVLCEGGRPCKRCVRMKRADCCADSVPKKRGRPTNEMRELRETALQSPPKERQEKLTTFATKGSSKARRRCLVLNTSDSSEILVNTPSSISSSSSFIDPQSPALAFLKTCCDSKAAVHSTEQLLPTANHDYLTVYTSEPKIYPTDLSVIDCNFDLNPLAAPVDATFADMSLVHNNRKSCNNIEGDNTNIDEWLNSTTECFAAATASAIPINEALSADFNFFLNPDQTTSAASQNTLPYLQTSDFIGNSEIMSLFNSSVHVQNRNFMSETWGGGTLSLESCEVLEISGADGIDIMDIELTEEDLNILESLI